MQEWLFLQEGTIIYFAIFLALVGGALGLPIPEDVPLIFAGIAVNQGKVDAGIVFTVCYASIVLADLFIYFVGRKFGAALFRKNWFQKRIPPAKINKIRKSLEKRSLIMILVARHLFYLRTVTFLTCGAVKVKVKQFVIADMFAALISVPVMMSIGYLASQHYDNVMQSLKTIELLILVPLAAFGVYYYFKRKKKLEEQEPIAEQEVISD